ncbi:hypothetical protein [Arthrobacter sp. AQ5-05]|uniref:hypothetical protein n=1 Tax=Arthrobacter sp. AQ5-05 TaxID=2184581 RepID=UPI001E310A63|nr:hypothetical protein [Arthrobacter sp. AQ5-05]
MLVTHDQEEALIVADRVGVMLNGRIEQLGSPEDVNQRPRTAFISEFVGAVNRIQAVCDGGEVAVLGRRVAISNMDRAALGSAALEALIRPEDLQLQAGENGGALVTAMVLRGVATSVSVSLCDASMRVDMPPA